MNIPQQPASELDPRFTAIFKKGSTTYFNSSIFFPASVRHDVFLLYAFVRIADDFVDATPQDEQGFQSFRTAYQLAWDSGQTANDVIIDSFVDLARRRHFDPGWTTAFFNSMAADLSKSHYGSLEELLPYIYGTAEVIGLYLTAILDLAPVAKASAQALGRSMQYINFIRDIEEDNGLGRSYLPLAGSGLTDLTKESAQTKPDAFRAFMRQQATLYLRWQAEAEAGFGYIPRRSRIPIMTASHMYNWTARCIQRDPFVVYRRKVKPSKFRILAAIAWSSLRVLFGRH